ncbi:TatD family hydrolase [Desulfocurvus vexinensis]|uniref:TatD family hydrolase n=1 Tax=Desulfocurvus vexinensis TaxID=399548 RepID=UPI00048F4F34|nr:TatD family hydrolase [Desulfocurvus vexinensis]
MGKKHRPLPETLGLPAGGVETHAHLDMPPLRDDLDAVIERAARCGVSRIGQVFLGPQAYHANRAAFAAHPGVFFLLGTHPHDAKELTPDGLQATADAFRADPRLRALGEIGLDFHYDLSPREVQRAAFADQLALARELDMPVVVHSREAWDETMTILLDQGFHRRPLLWHCFTEGPERMREITARGWLLSLPGPVTYPKNEAVRQAAAAAPGDRLVLETDSPFLAPDPYRGKPNEPALLGFTALAVAALRGEDPAALWHSTAANATQFFGL